MDIVVNPLSSLSHSNSGSYNGSSKQKNAPPRGLNGAGGDNRKKNPISPRKTSSANNDDDGSSSTSSSIGSNDDEEGNLSSSLKKSVVIIHDDLMTEDDDTDIEEEEEDEILGLAHKSDDVPSLLSKDDLRKKSIDSENYEYNAYISHDHDNLYHPTSSIFENNNAGNNNKGSNINQPGLFGDGDSNSFLSPQFSTSEETFLENTSFYERAAFNRRPSQLQHEMTSLNALGPPSHVLKARRLSKNTIKSSASTPITPVKSLSTASLSSSSIREKRKPSIVDSYSKGFSNSNNSAVSPRFMALRKLSEVTTLPPHSISYSAVPPVPQIPSTYQSTAGELSSSSAINESNTTTTSNNKDNNNSVAINNSDHENRILARIDDIIETQLQFHLGQVVWRASESHLEARRFWEEQRKEMFGFAATIVDRFESQDDLARRMTLGSLVSTTTPNSEENEEVEILKKELSKHKSRSQRQAFELDMLKTRNSELEKQHEIDTISIAKQWEQKDSTLKRLNQLEQQERKNQGRTHNNTNVKQKDSQVKVFNLETENKQLKKQVKQMQEVNRQLLEDATTFEKSLNSRDKELKHVKQQLIEAESQIATNKRKMIATESTTTIATGALDCSEDFGKKAISNNNKDAIKDTDSKDNKKEDINKTTDTTTTKDIDNNSNIDTNKDGKKAENWADIMESEDEAKKSAEEWAKKYRELQTNYFDVCLQLEELKKEGLSTEDEKKIFELSQSISAKNEEIRHLKQAENVNRIQMDYMQLELDKYQNLTISRPSSALSAQQKYQNQNRSAYHSKHNSQQQRKSTIINSPAPAPNNNKTLTPPSTSSPPPPSPPSQTQEAAATSDYVTEDGFLTFTTEINGQLSKYSIKLPNGYTKQKQPNETTANPPATKKNKLNPNAVTWKS